MPRPRPFLFVEPADNDVLVLDPDILCDTNLAGRADAPQRRAPSPRTHRRDAMFATRLVLGTTPRTRRPLRPQSSRRRPELPIDHRALAEHGTPERVLVELLPRHRQAERRAQRPTSPRRPPRQAMGRVRADVTPSSGTLHRL